MLQYEGTNELLFAIVKLLLLFCAIQMVILLTMHAHLLAQDSKNKVNLYCKYISSKLWT